MIKAQKRQCIHFTWRKTFINSCNRNSRWKHASSCIGQYYELCQIRTSKTPLKIKPLSYSHNGHCRSAAVLPSADNYAFNSANKAVQVSSRSKRTVFNPFVFTIDQTGRYLTCWRLFFILRLIDCTTISESEATTPLFLSLLILLTGRLDFLWRAGFENMNSIHLHPNYFIDQYMPEKEEMISFTFLLTNFLSVNLHA